MKERQKIFCHEYASNGWNATRAYKAAYEKDTKLSDSTCSVSAARLLRNANIKSYVDEIKEDYESLLHISKATQLKELAKIAYSSIAHLNNSWIELKKYEDLTPDQLAAIKSIVTKTTLNGTFIKIELHSKLQAIETINKMMGYNSTELIKVDQNTTTKVDMTNYTDEEKEFVVNLIRNNR